MEDATLLEVLYFIVVVGAVSVIYKHAMSMIIISILLMTILLIIIRRINRTRIPVKGKTVLVTGCDSGIGLDLAEYLGNKGFLVFATVFSFNSVGAKHLLDMKSKNLVVLEMNVTSDTSCMKCLEALYHRIGPKGLWAVVNSVDNRIVRDVELTKMDEYREILDVNLLGTIRVTKTFLPLIRSSKGCIVNISSVAGLLGIPLASAYTASKYGLEGFTESLRLEMKRFGVRVSIVECTFQHSEQSSDLYPEDLKEHVNDEISEMYGESYISSFSNKMHTNGNELNMPSICEAVMDAILSEHHTGRYLVGNSRKIIDFSTIIVRIRPFIPLWCLDNLSWMLYGTTSETAFEKKQYSKPEDESKENTKKRD